MLTIDGPAARSASVYASNRRPVGSTDRNQAFPERSQAGNGTQ